MPASRLSASFALVASVAALAACARTDDSWEFAVPPGAYDVSSPVCLSTGQPPRYPSADHKAALLDFDHLTSHTLVLDGPNSVETFTDADCTLTLRRTLHDDEAPHFSLRRDRRYAFSPEGCTLALAHQGLEQAVGRAYGDLFVDSDDPRQELPFTVTREGQGPLVLTTDELPALGELWSAYGCSASDRLVIQLNPMPKA